MPGARSRDGRGHADPIHARPALPRGRLVEFVRLIFVVLFAAAGYMIALDVSLRDPSRTILGVVLGSGLGSSGLALAALLTVPVFRLPPLTVWTTVAFTYVTLGHVGYRVGRTKSSELFGLIGLKPRAAASLGDVSVVDTSALIDGRILGLIEAGFLAGDLLIHTGVLRELQTAADSSDPKYAVAVAVASTRWRAQARCDGRRPPRGRGRRSGRGCGAGATREGARGL